MSLCTADIYDTFHDRVAVCELQFRSFGQLPSFYGLCSTLVTFEDHTPVRQALQQPGAGRVLVVDGGGSLRVGLMGDKLAAIGVENGWAGVVIHGAIRDSVGIDGLPLGVKALGATARRGWTSGPALRDAPVAFGGVRFAPGHWVYADRDCVLVSATELDLTKLAPASAVTEK